MMARLEPFPNPPLANVVTPPLSVTSPPKVFDAERASAPAPAFVSPPTPLITSSMLNESAAFATNTSTLSIAFTCVEMVCVPEDTSMDAAPVLSSKMSEPPVPEAIV